MQGGAASCRPSLDGDCGRGDGGSGLGVADPGSRPGRRVVQRPRAGQASTVGVEATKVPVVMARIAGREPVAKILSVVSTAIGASRSGVSGTRPP